MQLSSYIIHSFRIDEIVRGPIWIECLTPDSKSSLSGEVCRPKGPIGPWVVTWV